MTKLATKETAAEEDRSAPLRLSARRRRPLRAWPTIMAELGRAARAAARELALASTEAKNAALQAAAREIRAQTSAILAANSEGPRRRQGRRRRRAAFLDRLTLDPKRIEAMAKGLEEIAALPDPVGSVIARVEAAQRPRHRARARAARRRRHHLREPPQRDGRRRRAVPQGRQRRDPARRLGQPPFEPRHCQPASSTVCAAAGLPEAAIQLVPTTDREAVGLMLGGLDGAIDVIVPRGGKSLVARVQEEARVPVFAHLEGICHTYVDRSADLAMAKALAVNAKMRRTGVCGATETLLVDAAAPSGPSAGADRGPDRGRLRGAGRCAAQAPMRASSRRAEQDWSTEYLDAIISVRVVDGVDAAIAHIQKYGSQHTDCIVADDEATAERFLARLDSAIVLHNASTQFADGGEFGMGAEIGIATGRMHARGPVGVEQLTTFKYVVRGSGQARPV